VERGDLSGALLDGRYRVIEPVAEGAMGVVYRAERVKLGRIVAIKVLHDVLPNELSGRKRFEIEAMAMAKLEHPHCASVLDVGVHNDRPFVVMDFIAGQNLKDVVASGPQPIQRAAEIVRQVLSGLAHAHERGIIHRDIKPANIVLSHQTGLGDHVKILDFGLARLHDTGQNLTTGIVVGTPAYMAPEQIRGHELDRRVDLYACGVLLFELLTGHKPFHSERDDPVEVCRMHLAAPIPRLADRLPGVAFGDLEAVVAQALAKERDHRFPTAQAFAAALEAVVPRASRPTLTPVPQSGPIALGAAPAPDVSYPPAVEVRSADVMSAIELDRPGDAGAATERVALGGTPPAGLRTEPAAGGDEPVSGTFLGLPVTPRPSRGDRPASVPASARRGRRWRAAAIAVAVVAAGGGAWWLAAGGGSSGEPALPMGPAGGPASSDPGREIAARAAELAAQGARDAALDLLARSRKQHPGSAALAYTAGRIYFAKLYWTEGLRSFRDAIQLDPSYRSDPELIKTVLRGFITTPGYHDDLARFLRDDIGGAAEPLLEETARDHPSAAIRSRAAGELRRYRR
jgi:eukaryotic-like serine/threonine-protein kinase